MQLGLMNKFFKNDKVIKIFLCVIFAAFFLLTRIPGLSYDEINPDGVNWHYRSQQFVVGLKSFQFEKTYQHYHPGVTLMWISGIPIELYKQFTGITTYDMNNFLQFNLVAKLSVVTVQFVLSFMILYFLSKEIGFYKSFGALSLFTFEPFFIGNSRLYHMDALLSLFMFLSVILSYQYLKSPKIINAVLAGFFISMSFLTKSISIGLLAFVFAYYAAHFYLKKDLKNLFSTILPLFLSFVFFTFLFFPALWVKPIYYIGEIFKESERVGVRSGHEQIIFGDATDNAGFLFYPLVFFIKFSPLILIGVLATVYFFVKERKFNLLSFLSYCAVFYIGYVFVMFFPSKKIDRYMVPVFPFFGVLALYGYTKLYALFKKKAFFYVIFSLAFAIFIVRPFFKYYPYYFTYTSPVAGTPEEANFIIAQKPFGMGIPLLKQDILWNYGDYPKLGFYDTKPMKSIYPNSKVFDVRVYGPGSYDLLILGINEQIPDKVKESGVVFEKHSSIGINELHYWTIYVKK